MRRRGERLRIHDTRCACGVYTRTGSSACMHMEGGHGPHRQIHLDEVCELIGWGVSLDDIARRLGVKLASIERVALRRGTEEERAIIRRALAHTGRHRRAAA